jgi:hypothetical protein
MKKILLLLSFVGLANATVTSSTSIQNPTGSSITSVKTLVWGFKKGDIPHYPRPSNTGTPFTTWQVDQVTRWSDGSVKIAIISFPISLTANQTETIDWVDAGSCSATPCNPLVDRSASSAGSGMSIADFLAFNGGNWNIAVKLTYNGSSLQKDVKTLLNDDVTNGHACGSAGANCQYWLKGPVVTDIEVQAPLLVQPPTTPNIFTYNMGFDQGAGYYSTVRGSS